MDLVDAVIVGSGAGGGPVALELARAGAKVVVLEKGRDLRDDELIHDEIRMCRRNFFIPYPRDEPHMMVYQGSEKAVRSNEAWTSNVLGGGTVHMSAYFFRLKPVDFHLRSTLGAVPGANLTDWPFGYDSLEPHYARAEREMGVSGKWKTHPFEEPRSADYPLPPLAEHPFAEHLDEAAKKLGLHAFPTPRGILSRPYKGRSACSYCALCGSYGCEMGAKASTSASLLPEARKTGACEVRAQCMATEIQTDQHGRAKGVAYLDAKGVAQFQPARCVVVACSAVESARLLLMSRSAKFPNGLANGSGLVGRNLVFSGLSRGHGTFHVKGRDWMADAAPFIQRTIQDSYFLKKPVNDVHKAGTTLFAFAHPNPIFTAERISREGAVWGKALKQKLRDEARDARAVEFENYAEFLPTAGTYVELDPEVKDRFGLPAARIHVSRHPLDRKATGILRQQGLDVLNSLGADSTQVTSNDTEMTVVQGGTCRFGKDPAKSVLNPDCRAHEVPNLYVSDGSFLPGSGGVPLTLTILANAFRVGEKIAKSFKNGDL
ncbi:MAG TPA: GMC family oxidoreductase [Myxococcales bacterium]|jgi:choline dehydrogenase-like flavoprotein|nr:GMC family oxidoreductase [Myxococcales bacterium]